MVSRSGGTVFSARDVRTPAAFCRKPKQLLAQLVYLIAVLKGELFQYGAPSGRQRHNHNPRVRWIAFATDQPAAHGPADQPHHRVVPLLQEFRQFRHGGPAAARETGNPKHQLMLLRRNPRLPGRAFAKAHKLAQPVSETRQFDNNFVEFL